MPQWNLQQPPSWAPDAVASPEGWRDPVSNELLIAITGMDVKTATKQVAKVEEPVVTPAPTTAPAVKQTKQVASKKEAVKVEEPAVEPVQTESTDEQKPTE